MVCIYFYTSRMIIGISSVIYGFFGIGILILYMIYLGNQKIR